MTNFNQPFALAASLPSATTRNWWENPGENGTAWVTPFYNTATWDTTSAARAQLVSAPGTVNLPGNFAVQMYVGRSTDPTVTVTDGNHSITVHVPAGATVEQPPSPPDQGIGGYDLTQPYLFWSINGATIDGSATNSVRQGSVIQGTYGFTVGDASGPILQDVTVGTFAQNSMGNNQEYELLQAVNNSSYVMQHSMAVQINPAMFNNTHIWPLSANDTGGTGQIPEGTIIGIPHTTARPTGKTRGFYFLFDNLQQYGWMAYNVAGIPGINIICVPTSTATRALATDIVNSISSVMPYTAFMTSLQSPTSIKGFAPGATLLYPPPPPLDLSPTGGVNVSPNSFGAWYPGGYNGK